MQRGRPVADAGRTAENLPLREYAAIGDGRCVALVARDGSIDWLALPNLDSPTVFAALLDVERGGYFSLQPACPFRTERRYLPETNALETTFFTDGGCVRVTDALTLPEGGGLVPFRELQRRVDGVSGTVPMRWRLEPRFGYAGWPCKLELRGGVPVASVGADALGLLSFGAGEVEVGEGAIGGRFEVSASSSAVLALVYAHQEPLVLPSEDELTARFEATCASWRRWVENRTYDGPWRSAVLRSALALKLLVYAPSGAIAAAATASLPEEIGGARNWDYRFSWVRDSAFTIEAFLRLGCPAEADAYFWWLMHASQLTQPRLQVLYRLDGGARVRERQLPLAGYRGSRPVNIGNGAAEQRQLDTYGELLQAAWLYAGAGNAIDRDIARRLARLADFVCTAWQRPDAGIWEVRSEPQQFTQSKMLCAVALDRAVQLAERGVLPGKHVERWRAESKAIRAFVDTQCWSMRRQSYARFAGSDELDASVLLGLLHGYADASDARIRSTVDAISRVLARGPYVRRYAGEDGLTGEDGAFVACSFWLAESLARTGRVEEAVELMEQLLGRSNDVGLYSEELDPAGDAFLGNMPQGLSHLALISAAAAIAEVAG